LFLLIDIYSRYCYHVPLKTRNETEVSGALESILANILKRGYVVRKLDSDNESSFYSRRFRAICERYDITQNFNEVGDHKALAFIDRFSRTIRDLIGRYTILNDTTDWISGIGELFKIYNNNVHSATGYSPQQIVENNIQLDFQKEQTRAIRASARDYNRVDYKIGDRVRLRLAKRIFDKATERWTSTVHRVVDIRGGLIYVNDRVNGYKKADLLFVSPEGSEDKMNEEKEMESRTPIIQENRRQNTIARRLNKESVKDSNIKHNLRPRRYADLGPVITTIYGRRKK